MKGLIEWGGTLLVCIIVFIETGFFVGFFLPGDSLLVTAGVFAASGQLHISELVLLVPLCAIAGDQIGYWIGRKAGQALYRREDSLIFRKQHLERAHEFYEKYGGKTVILARFVPIIRTFCPPVAGAAEMPYRRAILPMTSRADFSGVEAWFSADILWAGKSRTSAKTFTIVIAVVIFLSLLPPFDRLSCARRSSGSAKPSSLPHACPTRA